MNLHASWIASGIILVLLAVVVGVILNDGLSQPSVKSDIVTDIDTLNNQADTTLGEIVAGITVAQTFQATEPNLSRIQVHLATYRRQNTAPLLLSLSEYPSADASPLRSVEAQPGAIRNNSYHAFRFAPILDSDGRTFVLTLASPGADKGNAFTAFAGECDCYREGSLFLQGEPQPQLDLTFQVGYENPPKAGVLGELVNRMSQYKPWFFKGSALLALGLLSLAFAVLAVGSFTFPLLNDKDTCVSWAWMPLASVVIFAFTSWFILR